MISLIQFEEFGPGMGFPSIRDSFSKAPYSGKEKVIAYLSKGRKVAVRGRIQTGSYKDRDGRTVYTTDVVADNVEFLTASQGENSSREGINDGARDNRMPQRNNAPQGENEGFNGWSQADDDLPY